jgi:hypothetical protein
VHSAGLFCQEYVPCQLLLASHFLNIKSLTRNTSTDLHGTRRFLKVEMDPDIDTKRLMIKFRQKLDNIIFFERNLIAT